MLSMKGWYLLMTMKPIPIGGTSNNTDLKGNDTAQLNIAETGEFSNDDPKAFTPSLPQGGFFKGNSIGPYTAANDKDRTVHCEFTSSRGNKTMHTIHISKIRD